jgi:hypothetical protein
MTTTMELPTPDVEMQMAPQPSSLAEDVHRLAQPGLPTLDDLRDIQFVADHLDGHPDTGYVFRGEAVDMADALAIQRRAAHPWHLSEWATEELQDDARQLAGFNYTASLPPLVVGNGSLRRAQQVAREAGYNKPTDLTPAQLADLAVQRVKLSEEIDQAIAKGDTSFSTVDPERFKTLTQIPPRQSAPPTQPETQQEPHVIPPPPTLQAVPADYQIPQWPPQPPAVPAGQHNVIPQWFPEPPAVPQGQPNVIPHWQPDAAPEGAGQELPGAAYEVPPVDADLMGELVWISEGNDPSPRLPELVGQRVAAMWQWGAKLKAAVGEMLKGIPQLPEVQSKKVALTGTAQAAREWLTVNVPVLAKDIAAVGKNPEVIKQAARRAAVAAVAGVQAMDLIYRYRQAFTALLEGMDPDSRRY